MLPPLAARCADACPHTDEIATHKEAIANLKDWQTRQNGTLNRLEDKIDGLKGWIMGALLAAALSLVGVIGVLAQIAARK